MNYSTQQIDEIRTIIIDLKFKKEELEDLEMDAYDIADSNEDLYPILFYYSSEERKFKIPNLSLLDIYNAKITNLKLEIESLEKRLQELVK
ncbi:hypothetical protein AS243_14240 [Enterococcus faecium]|uniref:hypothetical protein n=1 Tax=Enterococcus faecium TaxID=1352 RepID=UPI000763D72D|nr:hypothetical protein [Enterococcus faecium]KWY59947.1 hypothetical protein AS243_14240 [Enterococcus faecium]KWY73220.1 hypothetical protein AS247_12475 [Enterococcus faecium]KWY73336.1 hypothetical protein AS248_14320 [Enterococcus faecium]